MVEVPTSQLDAVKASYQADAQVARVEVDKSRQAEAAPSDPGYADQWALPNIGWDSVFGSLQPSGSSTIAVLDTGVDGTNGDLSGRLVSGYSAFTLSNES